MDSSEDEIVLISAIEHYAYCPRQFALMHVEQTFEDNEYTLEGTRIHERVDQPTAACHESVRVECAVPLWSSRLGLSGRADAVEFLADGTVYPVEYKHGARARRCHDDLQLCAQALCLEEMLGMRIERGAVYHYRSRRSREVVLDEQLRRKTMTTIEEVRALMKSGVPPMPAADSRCPSCSLIGVCEPELVTAAHDWSPVHIDDIESEA